MAAIAFSPGVEQSTPPVHLEPADVLSPSQISTFCDCAAKWWFKYGLNLPDPPTSNLTLGKSVHEAIGHAMQYRIETGSYPDADVVAGIFHLAWVQQQDATEFREDESPNEIRQAGDSLVRKYMLEAAPSIRPVATEIEVAGSIAGVAVRGRIDVLEEDGTIRDTKTSSRKPDAQISGRNAMQLAIYAAITPGASGKVAVDTLVKTKTPQLVSISQTLDSQDRRAPELQLPVIHDAMKSGYYPPNRDGMMCSRRNCPYWKACEAEYGGKVARS